jgi:hypothetical protein
VLAALAGIAAGATPVHAAEVGAAMTGLDQREVARLKLREGADALKRGDFGSALAAFQAAYTAVPSPKIKYDFGLAYLGLGRDAEALQAFDAFLGEALDAPADKRSRAEQYRAELRARVPAVAAVPRSPEPAPPGAAVDHAPAGPPAAVAPPSPLPMSTAGAVPGVEPRASRARVWALSSAVAGAVLVGAGVTFGVLASREGDSLTRDSQAGGRTFDSSKETDGVRYQTIETALLIAGGAALVAGGIIFAVTRHGEARGVVAAPASGAAITGAAVVTPSYAGGRLTVSF